MISTERSCWPDKKLAERYPTVDLDGYRFINSGGLFTFNYNLNTQSDYIQNKYAFLSVL